MKLGNICEVVRGSSPRPKDDSRYYGGSIPRLRVADVTRDGKVVSARIDSLTELGAKQSRAMCCGDIVIAVSGAPGLPAILAHDACIHDGFVGLRKLDTTRVNTDFLYSYLMFVRLQNKGRAVGAIFKNLTSDQVREIELPELSIAQQKRIAAILDKAEELRGLRRQALRELDAIASSIFIEMFGESVEDSKNSHVAALGSHVSFLTSGGRGWAQFYTPKGSRFIRSLDVQMNYISDDDAAYVTAPDNAEAKRTKFTQGDVLLTITGSRIGRVAPVPKDLAGAFISQHVAILRLNPATINPMFLSFFLSMPSGGQRQIAKLQYGQTKPGLNFEQINSFKVPVPEVSLQQEFARRVEAIEQLKVTHRESLAHLDALFASLQHRAFRGEL